MPSFIHRAASPAQPNGCRLPSDARISLETEPQSQFDNPHRLHVRQSYLSLAIDVALESRLAPSHLVGRQLSARVDD
jgi:hypothetical protein